MVTNAMMFVSIAALALLIAACGGPGAPGGGPGGTVDPEQHGTWNLDFGGTDHSSSASDDSYAAGW